MVRLRLKTGLSCIIAVVAMVGTIQSGVDRCFASSNQALNVTEDLHASHSHHDHDGRSIAARDVQAAPEGDEHQDHSHEHRHGPDGEEHEHAHHHPMGTTAAPQLAVTSPEFSTPLRVFVPVSLLSFSLQVPLSGSPSVIFRPPISS